MEPEVGGSSPPSCTISPTPFRSSCRRQVWCYLLVRAQCTGLEWRGKNEYPRARRRGNAQAKRLQADFLIDRSSGMPSASDWKVPPAAQPDPKDYDFDLDRALGSVVGIRSVVPADAFSAETLGTERAGNGVLIREDGLVLTIGYLITEAEQVWLTFSDGRAVPGHVLGYDQETGFGLVQALARSICRRCRSGNRAPPRSATGRGRRRRRPASFGRGAHRGPPGIRRLLGIRARRGDLHRAGASQLGRHGPDRAARRPARHRLAAARAAAREGQPSIST